MKAIGVKKVAMAALAAGVIACMAGAAAGQLGVDVTVRARLVTSSGACEATAAAPAVGVTCQQQLPAPGPGGPLLPHAGDVPYQRVGTIEGLGVVAQPLPVYSDGTKIASWRVVTFDNARYVELTIAW